MSEIKRIQKVFVIPGSDRADLPQELSLGAGEQYSLVLIVLPRTPGQVGGEARVMPGSDREYLSLRVRLTGPGASFTMNSLCLGGGSDRFSLRTEVEHLVGGASSEQLIRCVAAGESRLSFDGLIKVCPDAQRTQALQTSNNLLLSDSARVTTAPQLEIYADDVKCSHGATTGSLDEEEQYYMRSRGITLEQARLLQLRSFVWPVIAAVEDEKLREQLSETVAAALAGL